KREGDGATPMGRWGMRGVLYRPDRVRRPRTGLAAQHLGRGWGWCDAPEDRNYNRRIALPYPATAEALWRADSIHHLIAVLGSNDQPRVKGRGSAIFLHLARTGSPPTAGCIALERAHLLRVLARFCARTRLCVGLVHKKARPEPKLRAPASTYRGSGVL